MQHQIHVWRMVFAEFMRPALTLFTSAVALSLAVPAAADLVEVSFSATIDGATCNLDCLAALGGTLTGTFVYDDAVAGSGANPTLYPLQSIDLTTSNGATGGATGGTISIANDLSTPPTDGYTVGGTGTFGTTPTSPPLSMTSLSLQLLDPTGSVFVDTSLPPGAPPLAAFGSARVFTTWEGSLTVWSPVWNITSFTSTVICPGLSGGSPHSALNEQLPTVPPFSTSGGSANTTHGWRFRPTTTGLVVTRLGVASAISPSTPQTVTLFDFATQAVLAQAVAPVGPGWQWVDIPPVPLQMGHDYVVATNGSTADWYFHGTRTTLGPSWFPTTPIEYVEARSATSVTDPSTFPTIATADDQSGLVDIGYANTACIDIPGTGAGAVVDPAVGPPGQSFDLFVPDHGMLLDLDVALRLQANGGAPGSATEWDDLRITLRKGSRSFVLNAQPAAQTTGVFDVTFDSDATTSIASLKGGDATGLVRPDGPVLDPFNGDLLGGRWTLEFEDTCCANDTVLEGWELQARVMEEQTTLTCPGPGIGGDRLDLHGIRFQTDRPFQAVRLDLLAPVAGTYRFDAELRRSTGFTAPIETTVTMEAALSAGATSIPIHFGNVPVSGLESFTLKFVGVSGPGYAFFDVFGIGNEPCPNVEETEGISSATPTVRGDPANFTVVAVPEPSTAVAIAIGVASIALIERRRARSRMAKARLS